MTKEPISSREYIQIDDKVIFAVSFLAVLVGLSNCKDFLTQQKFIIFSYSFSAFNLLFYMSIALLGSVYCSAIGKLRDNAFSTLCSSKTYDQKIYEVLNGCTIFASIYLLLTIALFAVKYTLRNNMRIS